MKLSEVASRLACRLEGNGDLEVSRVAGIENAGPGDLTFFANPRYAAAFRATRATAVILDEAAPPVSCAMLRSPHPYLTFARAVALFSEIAAPPEGIHSLAAVATNASVGEGASIGPFVYVGDGVSIGPRTIVHPHVAILRGTTVGADCVIHSHAAVREGVTMGDRVIVQNGAVIGSDGFGFARRPDGTHEKIPQTGRVVIEDDVEIGALAAIDRPAVGETRIGAGTKIDNLVQIAHGVVVGQRVLLAAQVGVAGSSVLEDDVTLAGQVGVAGHLTIGKGSVATAQTGIPNSLPAGSFVSGYPAIENREWLKAAAVFRKLPEVRKTLETLKARVAELEDLLRRRTDPDA